MLYKICRICKENKSLDEFPVRKRSSDGHRNECRICKSKADYVKRLSKPNAKEIEKQKIKVRMESKTPEELSAIKSKAEVVWKRTRAKEKQKFLEEHGCDRKELTRRKLEREFLEDSSKVHEAGKYSYHLMSFKAVTIPIEIWCNSHNSSFWQAPVSHRKGAGCPICAKESTGNALRKSHEDFIKEAIELLGDKYSFDNAEYKSYHEIMQVTCKEHGDFPISPANLMYGKGCPNCSQYGYRTHLPGYFYIMINGDITKVGITNRTPEIRAKGINKTKEGFEVLYSKYYEDGAIPLALETSLLWTLPLQYKRVEEKFDGSTECFLHVDREQLIYIATKSGENLENLNDTRPLIANRDDSLTNC